MITEGPDRIAPPTHISIDQRLSLSTALLRFAVEIDAATIAAGIEPVPELVTLPALGVPLAQGYVLGRPADLATAKAWFTTKGTGKRWQTG
ncbi:MAG: hypothetical protein WEB56_02470 [Roseovarius sp.]